MNKIKCISRSWLYPNNKGGIYTEECYTVGVMLVEEITQNDSGCFNVEFKGGEIISVTDVQYVEYFPKEKNIYENTECMRHHRNGCEECFPITEKPMEYVQ